jgi:hypothetical protein
MKKKLKTFLSGSKKKRRLTKRKFCKEEFVSDHNSPILTINVS